MPNRFVAGPAEETQSRSATYARYPVEAFEFLDRVEERHFWFTERNKVIAQWLGQVLSGARRQPILEIGCGNGTVLAHLHRAGFSVIGVDVFRTALLRCRQRVPAPVCLADALRLPFRGTVETVGLFDCLEHFDRPGDVLAEVRLAMAPGGSLLVTVPALPALYGWVDRLSGHRMRYTRVALIALLQEQGFQVVRASYYMTAILPAIALSRLVGEWRHGRRPDPLKPFAKQFQVPRGMNGVLRWLCGLERVVLRRTDLPIGSSLVAVAKKR